MIKKFRDFNTEVCENLLGGKGKVVISKFVTEEELNKKGRIFGKVVLKPGCGIGFHVHEGESELYYIIKGTALYDDNGTQTTVRAGEVTLASAGTGHAIRNESDEDVEFIALIVYA